jgi:hypothetical protein
MLKDFFTEYSAQTIVIALIIAIIKLICDKFLTSKTAKGFTWYLPFFAGILFNYLFQVAFMQNSVLDENVFYAGIISGTLAYAFALIIRKIYRGEPLPKTPAHAVIEGLVDGYVNTESVQEVICVIYKHYVDYKGDECKQALEKITDTLNGYSNGLLATGEIVYLAQMIITALDELTD